MTRTLYLHCGPPKTGTSAIQAYLRDNRHHRDLLYPQTGQWGDGAHHFLTFALQGMTARGGIAIPPLDGLRRALEAEVAASESDVLISSEGLTPKDGYPAFRREFAGMIAGFDRVETLVVLRHPLDRAASSYNQNIKDPVIAETRLPDEYLLQHRRGFALMPFVGRWRAAAADVRFLNYHPAQRLLHRFIKATGRSYQPPAGRGARRNASLGGRVVLALLIANRLGVSPQQRAAFFEALRQDDSLPLHQGKTHLFSVAATEAFLAAVAPDLQKLRDRLGIDMTALHPTPPRPLALGPAQAAGLRNRLRPLATPPEQLAEVDRVLALFTPQG